jgi:hypothetical protein
MIQHIYLLLIMKLIGIETDLEPDDCMALYLLNKMTKMYYVNVGEGDGTNKYYRMKKYLSLLNSDKTILFRGMSSNKLFEKDGMEFDNLSTDEIKYDGKKYVELFKNYVTSTDDPIIVFLKPPRELMENLNELMPYLPKVTAYFYGGFNFRCLMEKHDSETITEMLQMFKDTYVYESFHATGHNNSITKKDKMVYDAINSIKNNPFIEKLLKVTSLWNNHLLNDCFKTCKNIAEKYNMPVETIFKFAGEYEKSQKDNIRKYITDERQAEKFYRSYKTYMSIKGNEDFQFVMADMCAVVAFFNNKFTKYLKEAEISFSNGYTNFSPCYKSNIYYYSNIDREFMLNELASELMQVNKKIYLITTPRTYSVCITRVLEQTGKFDIFHEPYVSVYDKVHFAKLTEDWFKKSAFGTSKDVVDAIDVAVKKTDVVVKDMAFAITDYIGDLIDDKNAYFILLFRNPLDVFISFYNKCKEVGTEPDPDSWRNVIGYHQLVKLYKLMKAKGSNMMICNTDDLMFCLNKIFSFLKMELNESYLKWDKFEGDKIENKSVGWKENKKDSLFFSWHREALQSTGINTKGTSHSFDEIENEKHRKIMSDLANEFFPVYNDLMTLIKA